MISVEQINGIAAALHDAEILGEEMPHTEQLLALRDGYAVQEEIAALREHEGDHVVGFKIGLTAPDAQSVLSTHEPGRGFLFSSAVHQSGAQLPQRRAVLVEIELCLIPQRDIPVNASAADILGAGYDVCAAIEVVSSRWAGGANGVGAWAADNAMATAAVIGERVPWAGELRSRQITVVSELFGAPSRVDQLVFEPSNLLWLHRSLAAINRGMRAGDILLTGALTGAIPAPRAGGYFRGVIDGVGSVEVDLGKAPGGR